MTRKTIVYDASRPSQIALHKYGFVWLVSGGIVYTDRVESLEEDGKFSTYDVDYIPNIVCKHEEVVLPDIPF